MRYLFVRRFSFQAIGTVLHSLQRAIRLDESDPYTTILFQVTGPAHIPWQDQRWQELLHGYDVWVHVEHHCAGMVLDRACQGIRQHAPQSSNLAAFVMHVTRMLNALLPHDQTDQSSIKSNYSSSALEQGIDAFSNHIAMVGRARATARANSSYRFSLLFVLVTH